MEGCRQEGHFEYQDDGMPGNGLLSLFAGIIDSYTPKGKFCDIGGLQL
jgi:hypothetical protein